MLNVQRVSLSASLGFLVTEDKETTISTQLTAQSRKPPI